MHAMDFLIIWFKILLYNIIMLTTYYVNLEYCKNLTNESKVTVLSTHSACMVFEPQWVEIWPFPNSLTVGFYCYYGETVPDLDLSLRGDTTRSQMRGRPRKKWLDNVKEDCTAINLSLVEASPIVEDRRF